MSERTQWLNVIIPIEPKGKGRPRHTKSGHTYTPLATRVYERKLREVIAAAWPHENGTVLAPLAGPIGASILAEFALPKAAKPGSRPHHIQKPDGDNIAKAVLDALNGIVFVDDAQVVDLRVRKVWATETSALHIGVFSLDD